MNELTEDIKKGASRVQARSTAQLPAYRQASNVLFLLTELVAKSPRKMLRFTDKVLADASEIAKCIALANALRGEERAYYLSVAEANACVVKTYAVILNRMGVMSKEQHERFKGILKNTMAQIAGWRDSINREGHR